MTSARIPTPEFFQPYSTRFFIDNPSRVKKTIEESFDELGEKAYGDANFSFLKWAPLILAAIAWILPGFLFGPIGIALGFIIGYGGYLTLDKLMENPVLAKYLNKPKWALELIEQGDYKEAIKEYDNMIKNIRKIREHIDKLENIPKNFKKLILEQVGHELSAKDFDIFESLIRYAQGVLNEALNEKQEAKNQYKISFQKYNGNTLALERIISLLENEEEKNEWYNILTQTASNDGSNMCLFLEARLILATNNQKYGTQKSEAIKETVKWLYEAYMKNGKFNKAEEAQAYLLAFHDVEVGEVHEANKILSDLKGQPLEERIKFFLDNEAPYEAAFLACKLFEKKLNNINVTNDSLHYAQDKFIFNVIENLKNARKISENKAGELHKLRQLRNKVVHEEVEEHEARKIAKEVINLDISI